MTKKIIPINMFDVCKITGKTRKEITALYPKRENGAYYLDKFSNYLKDYHKTTITEYCKKYLEIEWPKCPVTNIDVFYRIDGKGLNLSRFKMHAGWTQEMSPSFKDFVDRMKVERLGEGNPMYKKVPWNLNKKPYSEESRRKMSLSATARKQREFNLGRTSIELKMAEFLDNNKIYFQEQFQVEIYSVDFYLPHYNLIIETDGDFWHCNPQFYPDGPKSPLQYKAYYNDLKRQRYLEKKGYKVIRFWECDINSGIFKDKLLTILDEIDYNNETTKD